MHSLHRFLYSRRTLVFAATATSTVAIGSITRADSSNSTRHESKSDHGGFDVMPCACDSAQVPSPLQQQQQQQQQQTIPTSAPPSMNTAVHPPSLWRRMLAPIGILSLPLPRILAPDDPAFKISRRFLRNRQSDEEKMRKLVTEDAPKLRDDPDIEKKMGSLRQEIFQLAYGKGVTAQTREDFLIRYGCTGFNDAILRRLLELCASRGLVEVGAGHGQWQKALTDAYNNSQFTKSNNDSSDRRLRNDNNNRKQFDFVLAFDNNSNLPLNTHIYNQYTQPHHDYFGTVQEVESTMDLGKVLRSWACRGRALLLVYPPPGPMAIDSLKMYTDAAPDNDTLIYVGEGRGGANGDEALFDLLENGEWVLVDVLEVLRPPGDKGCEKLYVVHKTRKEV